MDVNFWNQRWQNNEIAFHENKANPLLVSYFKKLSLAEGSRVFVPLCGKTLDIAWLLANGFRVVGAELIETAVEQLFSELGVQPKISVAAQLKHYSAINIDIFVGDIFTLSSNKLGLVEAIYDRAALVALPKEMRSRYTAHLMKITDSTQQLLITFKYDQKMLEGPPFSISDEEVNRHYRDSYDLSLLASTDVPGGLKGKCAATENLWFLKKYK